MEEMPSYYSIIPAEVRYDKELKDKAKLLYGEITALSNKYGYCYASNSYFAELYGVTTTTISLLIKDLIDKGYVSSELIYKKDTKEIQYRYLKILKYPIKENLNTYLRNFKYPIKENLKDNNTSINNTSNNIFTLFIYKIINKKSEFSGSETEIVNQAYNWATTQPEFEQLTTSEKTKIKMEIYGRYEQ